MASYARVDEDSIVREIFVPHEGFAIEECLHPSLLPQFKLIPDGVHPEEWWVYDGTTFHPPS